MKTRNQKTSGIEAAQAYLEAKGDIINLLEMLQEEIRIDPDVAEWSHAKSLQGIRGTLIKTLSKVSGNSDSKIEDTLTKIR